MNSTACHHPLLSQALQFPQYGVRQKTVKLPPLPQAQEKTQMAVSEAIGFKAMELLFQGLSVLTKPLQRLGGRAFITQKVQIDW